MKKELNKWQFGIVGGVDLVRYERGWRWWQLYFAKLTSLPEEGSQITKKNYRGIIVGFCYWFPFEGLSR